METRNPEHSNKPFSAYMHNHQAEIMHINDFYNEAQMQTNNQKTHC